jgi:hypothetical protein
VGDAKRPNAGELVVQQSMQSAQMRRVRPLLAAVLAAMGTLAAAGTGVDVSTPALALPALSARSIPASVEGRDVRSAEHDEESAWRARLTALRALDDASPSSSAALRSASPRARGRQRLAARLRMPGAPVDDVCLRREGPYCVERSLDGFFDALATLESRALTQTLAAESASTFETPTRHVRVAAIGNSLIASDHITDIVRERLVERFGDGGRGFLLADRMAPYGRRTRAAARAQGLVPYHIALQDPGPHPYGIAGVVHVSQARATSRFLTEGAERIRFFWWDHAHAPALTVSVDGKAMRQIEPEHSGRARIDGEALPPGTKRVDVTVGQGAVLYGVSLERDTPGVILDTLGVPAADAGLFLSVDDEIGREQVQALDPALVLFVLGGNEIKRLAWGRKSLEETENEMRALFARFRDDAPQASCLVVGPLENVQGGESEERFGLRRQTLIINDAYRRAAHAHGCAYFDTYAAMGGRGALERLEKVELLHDDLVHPRGPALDVIGELVVDAMLARYDARTPMRQALLDWARFADVVDGIDARPLPGSTPPGSVVDVFASLLTGETDAFAGELSDALGVPVVRHALPVRPAGLLIDIETTRIPDAIVADATAQAFAAPTSVNDGEREFLRVVDGTSGEVLARAPLASVAAAHASMGDANEPRARARMRVLIDTARILVAAVMMQSRLTSPTLQSVTPSGALMIAGDAP